MRLISCKGTFGCGDCGKTFQRVGKRVNAAWLKDKFGLSWQVVPQEPKELLSERDMQKAQRVMQALLKMQKLDLTTLKQAAQAA
jgi:predicted 3-demethylubiquinone-9 3-methyltransferase (glyoxalase superfamily)